MLEPAEIVQRFLAAKRQVHPEVVDWIREQNDPGLVERIIRDAPEDAVVVSRHMISSIRPERDGIRFLADPHLEVAAGAAGSSSPITSVQDYVHYFRDRYTRLGGLVRSRVHAMPIEALVRTTRYRQQECTIIGMVVEGKATAKGHRLVQVEDPTGVISVLFNKNRPDFDQAEKLVPDEVVGVRGKLSDEGSLFFGEQILRPEVPVNHAPFLSREPGKAVLISDVHVGSDTFLPEAWDRFADWLRSSNDVGYLLIAGDLVDGIGIYPGQEQELVITDIDEQYAELGRMLGALPSRIRIVVAPGNHDVVRGAEPQPALPDRFSAPLPANCTVVENPCEVLVQGVRILMYHGRSIDDLISLIPGASYDRPGELMEEMLRRRHLAPSYGRRTPIAAAKTDRLLIDPVPEVLHTGHVHIMGLCRYRGVLGVNAGTWQSQTAFQKQMNVNPTPARAVALDLQTLVPEVLDFS
jgi:DNA polymerase II small subunit